MEFGYEDLVDATEGFSADRVIGKGSHGWVYRATVRVDGRDRDVAVKKSSARDSSKLRNETRVLSWLRTNPDVVKLMGSTISAKSNEMVMVMDLMPNGSLYELLHSGTAPPPPWSQRIDLALNIAKALRSLHHHHDTPVIIHRDIKSANILFDVDWKIKLADFGLAVKLGDRPPAPAGTIGYMDTWYTTADRLSPGVDVFSFGVVLLEIFSARKAIDLLRSPSDIVEWAVPEIERGRWTEVCDARLPVPSLTVMHMLRIAASCVAPSRRHRPTMAQVVEQMEACCSVRRWWWWTSAFSQPKKQLLTLREVLASG